jgi:hypothetical protein
LKFESSGCGLYAWTSVVQGLHPGEAAEGLILGADIIMKPSDADAALGRLAGSGRLLPNPHLLVNAYVTKTAVSSSRIEGTQASVTEVFDAVVTGEAKRDDIKEVRNYIRALEHGVQRIRVDDFPIASPDQGDASDLANRCARPGQDPMPLSVSRS